MATCYRDRIDAGRRLAEPLQAVLTRGALIFGIPRGGIPVGLEAAQTLAPAFDVFVSRKLGAPAHPEFGIGAIAEGGGYVLDRQAVESLRITPEQIDEMLEREGRRIASYVRTFRGDRPPPSVAGLEVAVIDDGLATGVTMQAAVASLRGMGAARIVAAAPVASAQAVRALEAVADAVVVPAVPAEFFAVGQFYARFEQLSDEEVVAMLRR